MCWGAPGTQPPDRGQASSLSLCKNCVWGQWMFEQDWRRVCTATECVVCVLL